VGFRGGAVGVYVVCAADRLLSMDFETVEVWS
jgi:hypothetical protein